MRNATKDALGGFVVGASIKKGRDSLVIYHEADLLMPAFTLTAAGFSALYLFRHSILRQSVKNVPQLILIVGAALCLLSGLFLLFRGLCRSSLNKDSGCLTIGLLFIPLAKYPYQSLTAVSVSVNHDYLYDRESGRPIIRRRRFFVTILGKDGRALFPQVEIRDYEQAMSMGRELCRLTSLPLRPPKRVRLIGIEEPIMH